MLIQVNTTCAVQIRLSINLLSQVAQTNLWERVNSNICITDLLPRRWQRQCQDSLTGRIIYLLLRKLSTFVTLMSVVKTLIEKNMLLIMQRFFSEISLSHHMLSKGVPSTTSVKLSAQIRISLKSLKKSSLIHYLEHLRRETLSTPVITRLLERIMNMLKKESKTL